MRIIGCLCVRLILKYYSERNWTCTHTNSLCTYSPYMCASVLTHCTCDVCLNVIRVMRIFRSVVMDFIFLLF